jgi:hypothetical protein
MDHFKILKRAWQIVTQYHALLWIGIVLVLVGGAVGAGSGFNAPNGSSSAWRTSTSEMRPPFGDMHGMDEMPTWPEVRAWVAPVLAVVIIVVAVLVLLGIVIGLVKLVLRWMTRSSLIQMVQRYEETGEKVRFGAGFKMGWSRSALRLFLLELMLGLLVGLPMIALIVPLVVIAVAAFAASTPQVVLGLVASLAVIPIALVGIVAGIVLSPIRQLAYRAVVIEDLGPWQAFKRTLGLVRRHLGPTALQWLILIGLGIAWWLVRIVVGVVLGIGILVLGVLPALLVGGLIGWLVNVPLGIILGVLILLPIALIVAAVPNLALNTLAVVYHSTVWTLTYRELLVLDEAPLGGDLPEGSGFDDDDGPDSDLPDGLEGDPLEAPETELAEAKVQG